MVSFNLYLNLGHMEVVDCQFLTVLVEPTVKCFNELGADKRVYHLHF